MGSAEYAYSDLSDLSINGKYAKKTEQVGGTHYKNKKIEPIDYIMSNDLNFCEGNIIKYINKISVYMLSPFHLETASCPDF